jgi:hypothetical protein
MKSNFARPTTSSTNHANQKKYLNSSKLDTTVQLKRNKSKSSKKSYNSSMSIQIDEKTDCQENVRMSLVSVDQANKENPQCVAIYCEKIFKRFLQEEVK